jgi:diacylglycerol kinase family enzyme
MRWVQRRPPAAVGHPATTVRLTVEEGEMIPVQADGDLIGERNSWEFAVSPAAVRLIGRWKPMAGSSTRPS